jgi:hypothetical protein
MTNSADMLVIEPDSPCMSPEPTSFYNSMELRMLFRFSMLVVFALLMQLQPSHAIDPRQNEKLSNCVAKCDEAFDQCIMIAICGPDEVGCRPKNPARCGTTQIECRARCR